MIKRVLISGGGTGGHIFPAIAIADEIKRRNPDVEILFVGASGKMEMEKVPAAGYEIEGLEIVGLKRKLALSNFLLPFKIIKSVLKARAIVKKLNPEVVVGVGGYASGPTLIAASLMRYPTALQEQNAFAGKTNKLLSKRADVICCGYEGMEKFFPADRIVVTGNPCRNSAVAIHGKKEQGYKEYGFDPSKKTLLIIGGSLGARTLNDSVVAQLDTLRNSNIQVLWQCGKLYFDKLEKDLVGVEMGDIKLTKFVSKMDLAYSMADLIISRAGASSVSELCLVKKPTILVPSPNVAEDHQTVNAMALVNKNAAVLIRDVDAKKNLISTAIELMNNEASQDELRKNIAVLGKPNATSDIVNSLEKIINR
ncbi:undecaprenyldiphospho-muramoylpentapeptide beta-N-acetylglucosaminyltransferase [Crocinitomicaceae bacterium]|nr:undecaprenyldiphospho-muramoylpentapeptide beta-N-acetylglucosaminyltransferase [Crocinitomicaceae bacterium]